MAKILFVGDSPTINTGFSNVLRQIIIAAYNAGHEVKVVGWCYRNEEHDYPFQIITPIDLINDHYGVRATNIVVDTWNPDIVFSLGDPWMVDWIGELPNRNQFKHIGYFPIDGIPFPNKWAEVVNKMDMPVVYSQFAYDLIKEKMPDKDIRLILHGIDTDAFYSINKEEIVELKTKLGIKNKYVVSCIARNQWRKNLPALFRAFSEFSQDKDDVVLYYHGASNDIGWSISELVKQYNLTGKVIFIKDLNPNYGVIQSDLNKIYNMSNVMTIPTHGEGFMLPLSEAHACETPVLVTNFSACPEFTVSDSELIDVLDYYCPPHGEKSVPIKYAIVDHKDYINKLNWFYYNQEAAKEIGKRGRQYVLEKLNIKLMTDSFIELIDEVMED